MGLTMAEQINVQDALTIIATALNEPQANVQLGVALDGVEGWDSMGVLLLIAELNERFDILLEEEQLSALKTVDDIVGILREHQLLS